MSDLIYITWHQNDTTYEATWNVEPDVVQVGMALIGMMEAHGWNAEMISEFIIEHINGKKMQNLPVVPCEYDAGFPGRSPG